MLFGLFLRCCDDRIKTVICCGRSFAAIYGVAVIGKVLCRIAGVKPVGCKGMTSVVLSIGTFGAAAATVLRMLLHPRFLWPLPQVPPRCFRGIRERDDGLLIFCGSRGVGG